MLVEKRAESLSCCRRVPCAISPEAIASRSSSAIWAAFVEEA
jgi:hypothetical protein